MNNYYLGNMSWPEADKAIKEARAVILPLGSTEQHGYHMCLDTDNIVASHVATELATITNCVVMPTLNYGQVWSAKDFPATFSLNERHYIETVKDLVKSVLEKGAKNIILFSGHWGNVSPVKIAARELLDDDGYENVYHLSYTNLKKLGEGIMETELWNSSGFHAGEIETSIMLKIAPERVDMSKAVIDYPEVPSEYQIKPIHWKKFAKTGIFGDATKATAQKGQKFLERWIGELAELILANIK